MVSGKLGWVRHFLLDAGEKGRWAGAGVAGLLWAAAFPNLGAASLAWLAPGLMLWAAAGSRRPFRIGYLSGLVFWLASIHWLLFIPVAFYPILGWVALCAYVALFSAVWTWVCTRLLPGTADGAPGTTPQAPAAGRRRLPSAWAGRLAWSVFCAAAWVGLEMIQARLLSGFPWNLLGTSQFQMVPLIQISSITGVYGVSFLVAWVSVCLLLAIEAWLRQPTHRLAWAGDLALPLGAVALLAGWGLHRVATAPTPARQLKLALIQPSIPQTVIWNSNDDDQRFREVLELSEAALRALHPDLLLWPEAAVPKLLRYDREIYEPVTNLLARHQVWLICGADDAQPRRTASATEPEADYFNGSFLLSPRGEAVAWYHKRKRVVFGEFVPLANWLPFLKRLTPITGGFQAGDRPVPFRIPELGISTSVLICFEDIFPHLARESVFADTDFLLNLTNDGWFGEGAAQWQQAIGAVFRAVENDLPLVRCANNGLTCWVDARGRLHEVFFGDSKDIYGRGFKSALLPLPSRDLRPPPTFYTRHGDCFGWGCVALAGAGALAKGRGRGAKG